MNGLIRTPTNSVGLKFMLVCFLALVMLAPILVVYGVVSDRMGRLNAVRDELSRAEGGPQSITGPHLLVPYTRTVVLEDGKTRTEAGEAVAFARTGTADVSLAVVERRKDIYTMPTYRAETVFDATFEPAVLLAELQRLQPDAQFDLARARLAVGVSNTVGIQGIALETAAGTGPEFVPYGERMGGEAALAAPSYDATIVPLGGAVVAAPAGALLQAAEGAPAPAFDVRVKLTLAGAQDVAVSAFAQNTQATIAGDWPDPSFSQGAFLPNERNVSDSGFSAQWSAPLARRGVPAVAMNTGIEQKYFRVAFVEPTNIYTGVDRALKYAILFIGLVFLAYFMFEVVSGRRAHPAQYLMVGLAQAIFYLLLLAFAERLGFQLAFLIAASATVMQISIYVWAVFKRAIYVLPAFAVFTGVYALVYVLLEAEDDALLFGAVAAFAALAALMFITRNVAWYGLASEPARPTS